MTVSEMSFVEDDQFNWLAVDHLVANAFYLRLDAEFVDVFPFPIFATYFSKTPQALVESAFDIFLPDPPDRITIEHYKHFPPRRLWDFPLEVGKKWVVFKKTAGIPVEVTRYVAEKDVEVTVPAGSYTTFVVHEEVVYADNPEPSSFLISPPAIYWVAPSLGSFSIDTVVTARPTPYPHKPSHSKIIIYQDRIPIKFFIQIVVNF